MYCARSSSSEGQLRRLLTGVHMAVTWTTSSDCSIQLLRFHRFEYMHLQVLRWLSTTHIGYIEWRWYCREEYCAFGLGLGLEPHQTRLVMAVHSRERWASNPLWVCTVSYEGRGHSWRFRSSMHVYVVFFRHTPSGS